MDDDDLPPVADDDATRTRLYHDILLKAVNNPARRHALELLFKQGKEGMPVASIAASLVGEGLLQDETAFKYHLDYLLKARCITVRGDRAFINEEGEVVKCFR